MAVDTTRNLAALRAFKTGSICVTKLLCPIGTPIDFKVKQVDQLYESPAYAFCRWMQTTRVPFQYPIRRLIVRSRKVSKARDLVLKWSYRFEIWHEPRQQCCRGACQISERSDNFEYKSRGFETLRDLTIRRLIGYWNGADTFGVNEWLSLRAFLGQRTSRSMKSI